ncbi:MAG: hypothetical protein ACP5JR_01925 [Thermoplasmata archaeon]
MRWRKIKSKAQTALVDTILFFIILSVAAAALYVVAEKYLRNSPSTQFVHETQYAADMLTTTLMSTINKTSYVSTTGTTLYIYDVSVQKAIEYYLGFYANAQSMPTSELRKSIEEKFELAKKPEYHYAVYAAVSVSGTNRVLFLSDTIPDNTATEMSNGVSKVPQQRTTSINYLTVPNVNDPVPITLYLWRAL